MKCLKCHFQNPEGLTLCSKCGAELEKVCPRCSFSNPPRFKFCGQCGHDLNLHIEPSPRELSFDEKLERIQKYLPGGLTQKILAQKGKIEGERKQVTVMFCDMAGFTSLTERLGPEEVYTLMDQVYEILIHKVHDYEGTVNEMTGDGIMALFGAPIALEDACQRAIRSAFAIHRDINEFSDQLKTEKRIPAIRMRIGIHTGPVVVGTLGNDLRVDFKAVGDTVNLASRMEGLADPGTTYVTEDAFKLTEGFFRFEALGKKKVKGKEEPIPVYKVLSAKDAVSRPRLGCERRVYSEMVGRESELNRLELQVMMAINGQGSVVNIIGEAGIGKSRLVTELKKREVVHRVSLLEGRAISIGRNLSYYPIIDLLKQWARIRADDGEVAALGKLEAAVRGLFPGDVGEVLPFVATLMGMNLWGRYAERVKGIEGEALEKLILKNVRELLIKATERTPLVIVIEDMHWADTSSIDLMESLFSLAGAYRILFLNVFRPGHKETGDRIAARTKERLPARCVEIVLEPLDKRMSESLVSNMLDIDGLHQAVIWQIIQRAGGNPFFIEEVVRSLFDQGAIIRREGRVEVTEKAITIVKDIPPTITDVLMARIDRLEEKTRHLVKVASVIGRSFFYRILSDVASEVEDIPGKLRFLSEIQLLQAQERMGEVEYLFRHALAQEAAYESLLPPKRRELHLKVAHSIEKIFKERLSEFYGMLAYHYSRAEDREKTEEFLIKAGEEALRSAASDEALHYYEEALQLYMKKSGKDADPEKVAMLEKNIALALYNRGRHEEALGHFDRALEHYWGKFPKNAVSRLFEFLSAFLHLVTALFIPSLKFKRTPTERDLLVFDLFYKKCKALAITNPKRFFIEFFFFHKTITAFDLQKFENGTGIFVSASPLFSFSGISFALSRRLLDFVRHRIYRDDVRTSTIYDLCETMHNFLEGNWKEIGNYDDDLIMKNCDIGEIWDATQLLYWHALPCIYQGSLEIAESILSRLDYIFQVYQYDLAKTYKHELKSCLLVECHKYSDALIEIKDGIDFEEQAGPGFWELYVCEARIYTSMGEIEKANNYLEQADRIRRQIRPVPFQMTGFYRAELEYNLYQLKEMLGNGNKMKLSEYRKKAIRSVRTLLRNARKVARYRTESYKLTGEYYWLMNKQEEALRWWHNAIKEGERLGARLQLAGVYFELGKLLLGPGSKHRVFDGISAEDYLKMARTLLEEIKLQSYLDELSQATRG
jgi:class 3 adenylate cyclase/tetratricopeptide (TPR) repeat protein